MAETTTKGEAMMETLQSRCDVRGGITSTITMTDGTPPWDAATWRGYAWNVTLRYHGRQMTTKFYTGELAGEPTTADVLDCLLSDASSVTGNRYEYADFEDFCANLGFDSDSRKAEQAWNECKAQTRKLTQFLGDDFETFLYTMERL